MLQLNKDFIFHQRSVKANKYKLQTNCIFKINQLLILNKKHMLNQLSAGEKIVMPKAVLRTISLQKLRNPSPLTQKSQNISKQNLEKQKKQTHTQQNKYEKILDKKLGINREDKQNKPKVANPKFQQIKRQVQQNQMKECTFKPAVNHVEKNVRNVNAFFNDQLNFCQKKNEKIEQMRAILQANKVKENIFRPNAMLNRNHKPQDVENVHTRLYQDSKNKEKQEFTYHQDSTTTVRNQSITKSKRFKGLSRGTSNQKIQTKKSELPSQQFYKISLQSNCESSAQMSAITTRKQSVQLSSKQNSRNQSKQYHQSKQPCKRVDLNIYEKKDNTKNQQLCIHKIMREIATIIQRCGLPLIFNYLQMNLFFQKMNFIPKESSDNTRKLLYEMWNMLQGQIFKEVSSLSVMKIVYAILGCHNVSIVNKCIQQYWLSNQSKVEDYDKAAKAQGKQLSLKQNLLMITERDSKTIKATFDQLYLNRLKLGQSQLIKEEKANQYAFRPIVSKASTQLAEKYRNRILQQSQKLISQNKLEFQVPQDGQMDHVNLLMLDEKRKEAVLQLKREQRQKERKKIQDESMISQNNLTQRSSNRSVRNINAQKDRNTELYEMAKVNHRNKKDKSTDEIEQEKWKNELTFKPNIKSRKNIINALNSKDNFIPDYDKAVYRMHEGRKIKQNGQKSQRSDQKNLSPLFYLNVVMQGSQPAKIPIFSQDNMKTITEKVRLMMDLQTQGNTYKLQKILKMQILPALAQMGIKIE